MLANWDDQKGAVDFKKSIDGICNAILAFRSLFRRLQLLLSTLIIIVAVGTTSLSAQSTGIQTNQIVLGWNLISFELIPTNPAPWAVFDTNIFKSVFTYDNASGQWSQYGRPTASKPEQNQMMPMGNVELGRAYWVYYDAGFATNWLIRGILPNTKYTLNFGSGWNLIGVPAGGAADINIISIFRPADITNITMIVRWEASTKQYQVYDPKNPESSQFQFFNPNLGHWVKASTQLSIQPEMVVEAEGDIDILPLTFPPLVNGDAWTPGPEDIHNGLPGDPAVFYDHTAQTVIKVPKGRTKVLLPLYNRGGGILLWNAVFQAGASRSGAMTLGADQAGQVLALERAHGVTSSETDTLKISIDRTHLSPGTYLAKLQVNASTGEQKTFDLVIEVGGLDGQWEGTASIQTINGRSNAVPDIDLFIHLFQDNKPGSRQLRGIVDSQETLLWPIDAQLLGHLTDTPASNFDPNYTSRFVIGGGLTMPPGDVNHPPFESFATNVNISAFDPDTGLTFLTNEEGDRWYNSLPGRASAPDFLNPFPRFISRDVELIGQLSGTESGATVATGDYYESIAGMSSRPIQMRGTFRLVRKTYSPLERRPYKYFGNLPINGLQLSANSSNTNLISVSDHVLINRVLVVVAQDATNTQHTLQLTAPNGVTITLHGGEFVGSANAVIFDSGDLPIDPLTLLDPPELRGAKPLPTATGTNKLDVASYESKLRDSLASYLVRRPRQSLQAYNDADGFGTWKLRYVNADPNKTHVLLGWSLLLYGAPAYPVGGQINVEGSTDPNRFQDVAVQVLGLNADLDSGFTSIDRTTGRFTVSYLPGLRVNLQATKPGYLAAGIDGINTVTDPRGYRDGLGGVLIGGPGTTNLLLTLTLPPTNTTPQVFTYQQNFNLSGSNGVARLTGGGIALVAGIPDSDIGWDLEWQGVFAPPVPFSATGIRAPVINLDIPTSAFTVSNNFTVAYRARAYRVSTSTALAFGNWVIVTLQNASRPPDASPYWNSVLVQGTVLQGFGAVSGSITDGVDITGKTAIHAQKTDVAKVDIDRVPLINSSANPGMLFTLDGLTDSFGDDAEDIDLFPRTFSIYQVGSRNNKWAYAEIAPIPDFRFSALVSPPNGQTPLYDDLNKGIDGRDINAIGEPVRIFTALGGRFCDLGVSGSDGMHRISAGANPGTDLPTGPQ